MVSLLPRDLRSRPPSLSVKRVAVSVPPLPIALTFSSSSKAAGPRRGGRRGPPRPWRRCGSRYYTLNKFRGPTLSSGPTPSPTVMRRSSLTPTTSKSPDARGQVPPGAGRRGGGAGGRGAGGVARPTREMHRQGIFGADALDGGSGTKGGKVGVFPPPYAHSHCRRFPPLGPRLGSASTQPCREPCQLESRARAVSDAQMGHANLPDELEF